jgi:pyrroline-5-carboxylate reductase
MDATNEYSIGIIGAGIMGEAVMVAIIRFGVSGSQITISDKRSENCGDSGQYFVGCEAE